MRTPTVFEESPLLITCARACKIQSPRRKSNISRSKKVLALRGNIFFEDKTTTQKPKVANQQKLSLSHFVSELSNQPALRWHPCSRLKFEKRQACDFFPPSPRPSPHQQMMHWPRVSPAVRSFRVCWTRRSASAVSKAS